MFGIINYHFKFRGMVDCRKVHGSSPITFSQELKKNTEKKKGGENNIHNFQQIMNRSTCLSVIGGRYGILLVNMLSCFFDLKQNRTKNTSLVYSIIIIISAKSHLEIFIRLLINLLSDHIGHKARYYFEKTPTGFLLSIQITFLALV